MPETQDLSSLSSNYCNVIPPDYYMGDYNLPHVYYSDDIKQRPEDYYAKLIFDPASIKRKISHPERKSKHVYNQDISHTAVVKSNSAPVMNGKSKNLQTMHNSEKEIIDLNNKLDQLLSDMSLSSPRNSDQKIKTETKINIDSLFEKYAKDSKFNDIGLPGRLSESENFIDQNHAYLKAENASNIAQKNFNGPHSEVALGISNPNELSDVNREKDISSIIHEKNEKNITSFEDKVRNGNHFVNIASGNTKFNKLFDKYIPQDKFNEQILIEKEKEKHVSHKETKSATYFPEINDGHDERESANFCENSDSTNISTLGDLDDQVNDKVNQPHPSVSSDIERSNSWAYIESLYEKYKPLSENRNDDLDEVYVSGINKVQAKKNRYELTQIPLKQKLSSSNDQQVLNRVTINRSSNLSDKTVKAAIENDEAFSRNFSKGLSSSSSNFDELNFYLKSSAHEAEDQNEQFEHINKAFVQQKPKVKPKPSVETGSIFKITMDAKKLAVESTVLKPKQYNIDLENQDCQKIATEERQDVIEARKENSLSSLAFNQQMIGTELKRRFSAPKQVPDVFKKLPKSISKNEIKYRDSEIQNVTVEKIYENIIRERIESSKELAWEKLTKSVGKIPEISVENVEITNSEVENLLQGLNNSNDSVVIQSKPKHTSLSVQSKFHASNDLTRSQHLPISASSTNKSKPNKEKNSNSNTMQVITISYSAKPLTICMRKCLYKHLHIAIVVYIT